MSLFSKISIIMSLFLLVVIISVMTLNFNSAQKYAQEELYVNAQNSATSLSLSLSNTKGNTSIMSTMINAVFDSGHYKEIVLLDNDENIIFKRTKEKTQQHVPLWFSELYDFETPSASANVSSGWKPIGQLQVTYLQDRANIKLYENFLELLEASVLISIVTLGLLFVLLKLILSSLTKLKEQAEAVSSNNFIITTDIPTTSEFKEVTLAMNKMVSKVKDIFEKEATSVQNYHRVLYTDTLTSLGNRNFFELKMNDYLASQEADANGVILTLFFDGVSEANKVLGHEKVNILIQDIATLIKQSVKDEKNVLLSRIDGTKFSIIFPGLQKEDIHEHADEILAQGIIQLEHASIPHTHCSIKIAQINYNINDTAFSLLDTIEKSLSNVHKNSISYTQLESFQDNSLDKDLIEKRINDHSIALALQDVFDNENNILHSEAYVRLFDEEQNMHEAGDFIPLIHKMHLDTKLDKSVINYAIKEPLLQDKDVAINISLRFLQDKTALRWLKERLSSVSSNRKLNFEISNHNLLNCVDEAGIFSSTLRQAGHNFGIDRFNIEDGQNLNYLQMIKPEYIKIDSLYLHEMLHNEQGQKNPALQDLIESLDIKIIASNLENQETKVFLEKMGIKYFQGSLLSKPKLA